jgi:hypothetical protein
VGSHVNNLISNIVQFTGSVRKSALGSVDLLSADTFGITSMRGGSGNWGGDQKEQPDRVTGASTP